MKTTIITLFLSLCLAGASVAVQGCASSPQQPVQQTTSIDGGVPANGAPAPNASHDDEQPDSVLGATAHAVWTAVLFPFRVVGHTVGLIL